MSIADKDTMNTILGVIGALAAAATPIIWGAYFWKYRHQLKSKRNR